MILVSLYSLTTKSGKKQIVNLVDRLFALKLKSIDNSLPSEITLQYIGSCRNDGTKLTPEQVIYMLEKFAPEEIQLLQVPRQQLILDSN